MIEPDRPDSNWMDTCILLLALGIALGVIGVVFGSIFLNIFD